MASAGPQRWVVTSAGLLELNDNRLFPLPDGGTVTAFSADSGGPVLATVDGLWAFRRERWRRLGLPKNSTASHVSALAGGVFAGLYGDGVYRYSSEGWRRLPGAPEGCRYPTAIVRTRLGLAVGTLADGVWDYAAGGWRRRSAPAAIPNADIYAIAQYAGSTWAASFDGGLIRVGLHRVRAFTVKDGLAANNPRSLLVYDGRLYVRYATGQVDCFDGKRWQKAFTWKQLPRWQVFSMATDGRRLYLGGWGGWAATDGWKWEYHYHDSELQGQVTTAMAAADGRVWIGTQGEGLLLYAGEKYTTYTEERGLTDDWITCIAVNKRRTLVGTYTGGLLEWRPERLQPLMKAGTYAIRAIAFLPERGDAVIATPVGLYGEEAGSWRVMHEAGVGAETQAVYAGRHGLWTGSRASLSYSPYEAAE